MEPIAVLRDTQSGNTVTIDSDRNSLIMYTMNDDLPDVHFKRDNGRPAKKQEGVALEAQTLPDAINQETFGDIVFSSWSTESLSVLLRSDEEKTSSGYSAVSIRCLSMVSCSHITETRSAIFRNSRIFPSK